MHVFMHTYTYIQIRGVCLNLKERSPMLSKELPKTVLYLSGLTLRQVLQGPRAATDENPVSQGIILTGIPEHEDAMSPSSRLYIFQFCLPDLIYVMLVSSWQRKLNMCNPRLLCRKTESADV